MGLYILKYLKFDPSWMSRIDAIDLKAASDTPHRGAGNVYPHTGWSDLESNTTRRPPTSVLLSFRQFHIAGLSEPAKAHIHNAKSGRSAVVRSFENGPDFELEAVPGFFYPDRGPQKDR
jgi:hypothetical protein